jgi:hypothetical protein
MSKSDGSELRDAKKVVFYAQAEVKRLESLKSTPDTLGQQRLPTGGPLTGCIDCKPGDCPCRF